MKYDAVVIGAGNGGLAAACCMAHNKMKVLVLEQHNIPGGFASSFVRGRFEFEPSLHQLGDVGDQANPGGVLKEFNKLGIDVDWNEVSEAFVLICNYKNKQVSYELPFGIEEFALKVEHYHKNSYKKVKTFLNICEELYECGNYLTKNKGKVASEILKKYFPNFLTTSTYSLSDVLKGLKIKGIAKTILETYWTYLGLPPSKLNFTLYAIMFYEYIKFKAYIPSKRSYEISIKLASKIIDLGGDIWYNTSADEIIIENNKIVGVKTKHGVIQTRHVVSNISPNIIYGDLIKNPNNIPQYDKNLVNYRKLNMQGFCVYLGLDVSCHDLNLNRYSYFIYNENNSDAIFENFSSIQKNKSYIAVVLNNVVKDCSPANTCIISLTTLYNDAWNNVDEKEYFKTKEQIAALLISDFEKKMNIDIKKHIEEIEIATPITFARYTNSKNGTIYGYQPTIIDGTIVRSNLMDEEINVQGLLFCGGYSFRAHGFSTTYASGYIAGLKTLESYIQNKNGEDNE